MPSESSLPKPQDGLILDDRSGSAKAATPWVPGYRMIHAVRSWEAFVETPLTGSCNAVVWVRELAGDFGEVAAWGAPSGDVEALDVPALRSAKLTPSGRQAADAVLHDLDRLKGIGHEPGIERVERYPRDDDEIAPTDVYSFHVDSSTVPTETILCTYAGRASEGLRLDQAQRMVDVDGTRAKLLERFGGDDDERFAEYLRESHLELHYKELPGAEPFSFGVGNLWRLAVQYPGSPAPAFIHRAPAASGAPGTRLLLIS